MPSSTEDMPPALRKNLFRSHASSSGSDPPDMPASHALRKVLYADPFTTSSGSRSMPSGISRLFAPMVWCR